MTGEETKFRDFLPYVREAEPYLLLAKRLLTSPTLASYCVHTLAQSQFAWSIINIADCGMSAASFGLCNACANALDLCCQKPHHLNSQRKNSSIVFDIRS
eukprot:scaffold376070_cov15-Prasinocladus_malaysianus.AAC.1